MSNPTIAAFTTIRSAANLRRPPVKTTYHTDAGPITTHDLPSIVKGPFCKWYRNPIWWWKMRHLRKDINTLEGEVSPEFQERFRELEEDAFINGTGERVGQ